MAKARINLSLDPDLVDFIKVFAAENRTTVAEIISQYMLALKRRVEGQEIEAILAHPAFHEAMEEMQTKLQNGEAEWHTYDDVFGG